MTSPVQRSTILFISTYPPVRCGIATFTQDLINAISMDGKKDFLINVCSLEKKGITRLNKLPVNMVMDGYDLDSCIETADIINHDPSIELICVEHEFGLYGGELGEFLLGFLTMLEKPFIIRFHTVVPHPEPKRLKLVQTLTLLADKVIVMTANSARLLTEHYQLDAEKVITIPHGTHASSAANPKDLKIKYGLHDNLVLTTFGLLSPNKGIEKGILAMKDISTEIPKAKYIVLGQTHPNLLQQEGEKYRNYLQQLIDDNGLQENVRLVNEYVPTKMLMEYLALTDIYLFTSKDPDQAVSGTFLYAMSAGCPVISNSFVLAKEMLDQNSGIILETNEVEELAENAISLLLNRNLRKKMGYNAYLKTRDTAWKKVAEKHIELFDAIQGKRVVDTELLTGLVG